MQNFKLTLFLCASLVSLPAAAGFEFVPSAGSAPVMNAYKAPPVQQNALPVVTAPAENYQRRAPQSSQRHIQMQPIMENGGQASQQAYQQAPQPALQYKMVTPPVSSSQPQQAVQAQTAPQPLQPVTPPQTYQAHQAHQAIQAPAPSVDWNQSAPVMPTSGMGDLNTAMQGSSAPFYQDYTEAPLAVTPSYQSTNATMGSTVRSQRIPVYSEVGTNGDAFMPYPRRQKKQSLFSINPFPFGNQVPVEDQAGLLFGQPVRVSASASGGNYGMPSVSGAGGPYMNRDNASAAAVMGAPVPPQKRMASANMPSNINLYADSSYKSYDNVVGFGKDMPLTIALGQVVPDRYAFSYGKNVDMGKTASWEGNKPWNEVLDEMLSPLGLMAVISNDTVRIESKGQYSSAEFSNERSLAMTSGLIVNQYLQLSDLDASLAKTVSYDSTIRLWTAPKDATLRRIIETWAYEAGVEVYWQSDYDYPMQAPVNIRGTFQEAITILLNGLREAQPRPVARLHPNLPDGPAVIVVETRHVLR